MAKFKEHVLVASVVSTCVCTVIYSFHLLLAQEILVLFLLGIIGTMIPDLDSDTSKPLRLTYNLLSFCIPILVIYFLINIGVISDIKDIKQIALIYIVSFFMVFIFFRVMMSITKHRGIIHSVPMAVLVSLGFAMIMHYFSYEKVFVLLSSWLLFLGFITHLVLDEIYSIVKLQKSFGTAFKFYSKDNVYGTMVMYGSIALLLYLFPYSIVDFNELAEYFKSFFKVL